MTIDGKEYSNEELSRATEMLEKLDKSGYEYTTLGREKYLIDNFIPKDKIRELIKKLEKAEKDIKIDEGAFKLPKVDALTMFRLNILAVYASGVELLRILLEEE